MSLDFRATFRAGPSIWLVYDFTCSGGRWALDQPNSILPQLTIASLLAFATQLGKFGNFVSALKRLLLSSVPLAQLLKVACLYSAFTFVIIVILIVLLIINT